MNKQEITNMLINKSHDFLNAVGDGEHKIADIILKGFYVEVVDVADILYPMLKDAKKSTKQIWELKIHNNKKEVEETIESEDKEYLQGYADSYLDFCHNDMGYSIKPKK